MNGKVIVVVGATGGIGQALVPQLAEQGATLVLSGRNVETLSALSKRIQTPCLIHPADICDYSQVQTLITTAKERFGRIDALVNVAGAGLMKQFTKLEPADLDYMLDVNLKGCFYTSQLAAEAMKDNKGGHICTVVGILGKHSMPMGGAYCASKFGLVGLSKCLAEEVKRYGIKVTLFYFGGIDTPFWDSVSLKVDRSKMLRPDTAAKSILFVLQAEPQAIPMEINIQPESHLFF